MPELDEEDEEALDEESYREQEAELRRREEDAEVARFRSGGPSSSSGAAARPLHRDQTGRDRSSELSLMESQRDFLVDQMQRAQEAQRWREMGSIGVELNALNDRIDRCRQAANPSPTASRGAAPKGSTKGSGPKGADKGSSFKGSKGSSQYDQDKRRRF